MDCKEIRVDMRNPNPEGADRGKQDAELIFKLNHTMPMTEEYNALLKELFGEHIGEGSYIAPPISMVCADQVKIGKFIAACRKDAGFTQAVLAEKLGISDRAVSKWENGKSMPDSGIMLELCELLKLM